MRRKTKRSPATAMALEAERIADWFASQGVGLRPPAGKGEAGALLARIKRYRFHLMRGRLSDVASRAEDLARVLKVGELGIVVGQKEGYVTIDVPREEMAQRSYATMMRRLSDVPAGTSLLGESEDGRPLLLRLPSADVAHVLICGTTGSGKTALARTMIASLAEQMRASDLMLVLIDPKGSAYGSLGSLPHIGKWPVLRDAEQVLPALEWLLAQMDDRERAGQKVPLIVVFIDELADLVMQAPAAAKRLTRLVQRGRSAGIHLVACTQHPTSKVLTSLMRANFPVRIVGSVVSATDAVVAAGQRQTGAEKLLGRGDFLLVFGGMTTRFQAPWLSQAAARDLVVRLRGGIEPPSDTARELPSNVLAFQRPASNGSGPSPAEIEEVARLVVAGEIPHVEGERRLFDGRTGGTFYNQLQAVVRRLERGSTTTDRAHASGPER